MSISKKQILFTILAIAIVLGAGALFYASSHRVKTDSPANASSAALPKNILSQIPADFELMTYLDGELNEDKLTDYLVVIHKKKELETFEKTREGSPRPLLIFTQNSDHTFKLAGRNNQVVFAIDEGGQCDPFEDSEDGLVINKHYFTVQNSVACGQHWNEYITFKYSAKLKNWVFHKRTSESWVLNDSEDPEADALVPGGGSTIKANPNTPILFENYNRDD